METTYTLNDVFPPFVKSFTSEWATISDGNIIIEFSEPILFVDGNILSQDAIKDVINLNYSDNLLFHSLRS